MIQNKTIWITGASSGLGEALALTLSAGDNNLILSARRGEELERVKTACQGDPNRILVLPMDMSERTGMEALSKQVINQFGVPDIAILNAGISNRSALRDQPLAG